MAEDSLRKIRGAMYEPRSYWDSLLGDEVTARTVGYPELSLAFNIAAHGTGRRAVSKAVPGAPGRVLDIGSGAGLWVDYWLGRGATDVVGVDLSLEAVTALRTRVSVADLRAARHHRAAQPRRVRHGVRDERAATRDG